MIYRSNGFRTEKMARRAYDDVRDRIRVVHQTKTGSTNPIRIPSEAIRLVQETSGITQCTGLEDGFYRIRNNTDKRTYRWDINVNV